MATITKRNNTYRIRVSCGYDTHGKQIIKSTTWTPEPGMTKRQIEKELERQKVLFEEKCRTGQFLDSNINFETFAKQWFSDYAEKQLKLKTVDGYKKLTQRIYPAIGHIKLSKLQPNHLIQFYNNLQEDNLRMDIKYKPCKDFKQKLFNSEYTQKSLSEKTGVSLYSISSCVKGKNITTENATKISSALGLDGLFKPSKVKNKLSANTIAAYHRVISSILSTAVQWQVIPANPCERVKPPKAERKEAESLDENQALNIVEKLQDEPIKFRSAIMLLLYTGMRRGELCGLEWSDIDFKHNIVHITKNLLYLPNIGLYEDSTKTKGSQRVTSIPPNMTQILKEYKIYQEKQQLSLGDQWEHSNKIFTSETGGMMHPDTLSSWFTKFIKRHNLPKAHLHTLRHTSATLLIASGMDIRTVSNRLGHADTSTTLNIYTHAIKSANEIAAEKLQNILEPTKHYKAN